MELSAPKLCSATIAHPDFSRHTWAKTAGLGCSKTSAVDPADLRLLPVRVDEVTYEPPEGLVVVALVGGVDTLRAVEAVGEGTGKPALLGLGKPAVVARGPLHGRAYG